MKYTYLIKNKVQITGEKEIDIKHVDNFYLIHLNTYTSEYNSKLRMKLNTNYKIKDIVLQIKDTNSKEYKTVDLNKIKACDEFYQEDFFFLFLPKLYKENQRFYKLLNVETKNINLANIDKIDSKTFYLLTSNSILLYDENNILQYFENQRTGVILERL